MLLYGDGQSMTYSFVKPDPGPSPKDDVTQIQTNFSQFGSIFATNHTAMNDRFQGDHTYVVLTKQGSVPTNTGQEAMLFARDAAAATAGPQPQLFVKIPDFLPTDNDPTKTPSAKSMQLTYNSVNVAGPQYQSFLPGGYILYIGSETTSNVQVTLVPAPTQILLAIATVNKSTGPGGLPFQISTRIDAADKFTIFTNATNPFTVNWYAIGQA